MSIGAIACPELLAGILLASMPGGVSGVNFVQAETYCAELMSNEQSWRKSAFNKEMAVFRLECRGLLGAGQEFLQCKASKEHICFLRRLRPDHACLLHNVHFNIKHGKWYHLVFIVHCRAFPLSYFLFRLLC